LYELNVLVAWKNLCHAVSWHLIYGSPLYVKAVFFDLLADPALVDVDVLKLGAQFVLLFCDYPNSLLIVTPNDRRLVELQGEFIEEAAPLLHL
jgi:hypothetical protein